MNMSLFLPDERILEKDKLFHVYYFPVCKMCLKICIYARSLPARFICPIKMHFVFDSFKQEGVFWMNLVNPEFPLSSINLKKYMVSNGNNRIPLSSSPQNCCVSSAPADAASATSHPLTRKHPCDLEFQESLSLVLLQSSVVHVLPLKEAAVHF